MKNNMFRGVTTALITPFLENGQVNYEGLRQNVRFQIQSGVHGLLPLGTTGETPTLTENEKDTIVTTVLEEVEASGKQVRIIRGVGTNSTQKTINNAKHAEALGIDAVLVVTPYYNKPTQDGIYAHFSAVNKEVNIPIVVYNIEGRTGVNIETSTLRRLAEMDNVIAVKEASGNINQMMDVIVNIPEMFIYSGDDAMTFPLLCLGGHGVISVVSNLLPGPIIEMVDSALDGDVTRARKIHFELLSIFIAAFYETNPGPIKYAMDRKGMAAGPMRLPLVEISHENKQRMDRVLQQI